jgi:hypothetical protein
MARTVSDPEIAALVVVALVLLVSWWSDRASRADERAEDAQRQAEWAARHSPADARLTSL